MLVFAAGARCPPRCYPLDIGRLQGKNIAEPPFYVVVEELIPEASSAQHSNLSTIGFAIGFVLMMVLDVVIG